MKKNLANKTFEGKLSFLKVLHSTININYQKIHTFQQSFLINFQLLVGLTSYEIMSADIEYLPTSEYIDLDSAKEEEAFKKLISLLNDSEFVTGVYHNCSLEMSN